MSGLVDSIWLGRRFRFAQAYLRTGNALQSYMGSGYSGNYNTAKTRAYKLLATPQMQELLTAVKAEAGRQLEITAVKVLRDLEELKIRAADDKRYSAAVRCCELQAKYLNLFPDQHRAPLDEPLPEGETVEPVELQVRKLLFAVQVAIRTKANGHAPPAPPATTKH